MGLYWSRIGLNGNFKKWFVNIFLNYFWNLEQMLAIEYFQLLKAKFNQRKIYK